MSSVETLNSFGGTEGSAIGRVVVAAIAFITKKICGTMACCFVGQSNTDRGQPTPSRIVLTSLRTKVFG